MKDGQPGGKPKFWGHDPHFPRRNAIEPPEAEKIYLSDRSD